MKYAFMRDHQTEFRVSRSGFYAWLARPLSARAETDRVLTDQIVRWHHQTRRVYGAVTFPCSAARRKRAASLCNLSHRNRI